MVLHRPIEVTAANGGVRRLRDCAIVRIDRPLPLINASFVGPALLANDRRWLDVDSPERFRF